MIMEEVKIGNKYLNDIAQLHAASIWDSLDNSRRLSTSLNDVLARASEQLSEALTKDNQKNIVISARDDEGKLMGFVWVELIESPFTGEKTGHIVDIHVIDCYRRQGVASELMAAIQGKMKQCSVERLTLNVAGNNKPALEFYRKNEFNIEMLKMAKRFV
jgi:ribosomal protein S18 acetylase RimI-like enzyme